MNYLTCKERQSIQCNYLLNILQSSFWLKY